MERFHIVPIVIISFVFLTGISCYNLNQNNGLDNWSSNHRSINRGVHNGFDSLPQINGYGINNNGNPTNLNSNNYNPYWPFNGPYGPFNGPYGPFNGPYGPFSGPANEFSGTFDARTPYNNMPSRNGPRFEYTTPRPSSQPPTFKIRNSYVPPFTPTIKSNYDPIYRHRDVETLTEGPLISKDREPIDIDVVSGTIGDPDDTQFELAKPHEGFEFGAYPFDTSSLFQHTFGDFFGNVPPNSGFPGFGQFPTPWWKGPNVCTDREEIIDDQTTTKNKSNDTTSIISSNDGNSQSMFVSGGSFNLNFESCYEKPNKHVCKTVTNKQGVVKTVTVTHQCCHGTSRTSNVWNSQCEKVDLVPVQEAAEKLGAKEFVRSAMSNGLDSEFRKNITLFAPIDEAFTDFTEHTFESNLVVVPLRRDNDSAVTSMASKDIILAHVVEDWVNIEDIENEQILQTAYQNSTIRMNIFPRPPTLENYKYPYRYTANCAPISKANQIGTNGIVHVVDKVLPPVTKNLYDVISERRDMTILKSILDKTDLAKLLKTEKALTFFAPTDSAFEKLEPGFKKSLKDGNGCATNILKNHILDLTFCSCAVVEDAKTSTINILGEKLSFERSSGKGDEEQGNEIADLVGSKDVIINGKSHIIESDLMGTNGVIHVIDNILPTDSGLPISSMLDKQNLTIFKRLIEAGKLQEEFDSLSNVTFFAPNDKAFENSKWKTLLEENPAKLKNNPELREFLEYHIAEPMVKTCDFTENDMHTIAEGKDLRINLYTTHPIFTNIMNRATVNCARLIHFDDDSCGSVLHQVDKILESPTYNLYEQLEANPSYSMFLRLIKEANLTELLKDTDQDLTVFVAKDDVFREVQDWYDEILENKPHLATIVKAHILPDVMCCAGIVPSDWPFVRSVETINNIHLKLDRDRRPKIQNAGITKCDINAKNGIIHEINDIITVRQRTYQQQPPRFW